MYRRQIIPALADLSQDIAGPIPVEIVREWTRSGGTKEEHDLILSRYERKGTIVSSDSSGLSKLSHGKPLAHVMKLIHEPKQIIFDHGTSIGGEAVGIWAADNTQMFYAQDIDVNLVVRQMVLAQQAIEHVLVDVGIGIHTGTVYYVGGGLYGKQADYIEDFTEEESRAKQILISPAVKRQLRAPFNQLSKYHHMYELDYRGLELPAQTHTPQNYPAPFSTDFYRALTTFDARSSWQSWKLRWKFAKERAVILFRVFHAHEKRLLDLFLQQSYVNTIIHGELQKSSVELVKTNGALGIFTSTDDRAAIQFARQLLVRAKAAGYLANASVCRGEVMVFQLEQGTKDIAGGPVNSASKLAEDTQDRGVLFVDASMKKAAARAGIKRQIQKQVSGIEITAYVE